jgi:Glu-tRNA(Gln) amidotransferase subunit E-like FAD-binding protein
MITGFNHNIKYKNLVFHVQTEDSGEERAHIITHLFIGGNIIISVKNSYKNVINAPQMRTVVKSMMEQQHKSVLKGLLSSKYDKEIDKMLKYINSSKNKKLKEVSNEKDNLNIIEQEKKKAVAHLIEDKQKSILDKNKKASEENLDDLILSFLEDNL